MSEPVAWKVDQLVFSELSSAEHQADIVNIPIAPLYTQPMRELTDEEIRKVADEVFKDYKNWHHYQIDFARAILKKTGEK